MNSSDSAASLASSHLRNRVVHGSGTMDDARATLKRHFAFDDFRPGQREVVQSILSGADTLGVLPTGGGKSLCYQVPALVLPGLTVVISPLISLMKDQVDRLRGRGIAATYLNSTLRSGEVAHRLSDLARGELKLLYVAPERFDAGDLLRRLVGAQVSLLAVDEAHCISEWGHEFRPSFRRIAALRARLGNPPLLAVTATATPRVRADIAKQLAMRQPRVIVSGFDRANLHFAVTRCKTDDDKERALLETLRRHGSPAIVYASTRKSVESIARSITRAGVPAAAYHAGLDDERRHTVQEQFMQEQVRAIVATNAFGMGIDKANVRLVVHHAMPGTLEAYYQEAGRAGRDGQPANCVLLHAYRDRFTHEYFIRGSLPERVTVDRTYAALRSVHVDGVIPEDIGPLARRARLAARDVEAALGFLTREQVVVQQSAAGSKIRVRLLATPVRIRRELAEAAGQLEIGLLRALWRAAGEKLYDGTVVDTAGLPPGLAGPTARGLLEQLQERQFVTFGALGGGAHLRDPAARLEDWKIDWRRLEDRRRSELAKLESMQCYAYTKNCRRLFVLRYFGDRQGTRNCSGCDNCAPKRRRRT